MLFFFFAAVRERSETHLRNHSINIKLLRKYMSKILLTDFQEWQMAASRHLTEESLMRGLLQRCGQWKKIDKRWQTTQGLVAQASWYHQLNWRDREKGQCYKGPERPQSLEYASFLQLYPWNTVHSRLWQDRGGMNRRNSYFNLSLLRVPGSTQLPITISGVVGVQCHNVLSPHSFLISL